MLVEGRLQRLARPHVPVGDWRHPPLHRSYGLGPRRARLQMQAAERLHPNPAGTNLTGFASMPQTKPTFLLWAAGIHVLRHSPDRSWSREQRDGLWCRNVHHSLAVAALEAQMFSWRRPALRLPP
jgi:hypothetical protein